MEILTVAVIILVFAILVLQKAITQIALQLKRLHHKMDIQNFLYLISWNSTK